MNGLVPAETRELGGMETAMAVANARWPLNMVTVLRLDALPDADLLRTTLDELQRRHPPLRARIQRRRRRRRFVYEPTGPIPLRIVDHAGPDTWTSEVETLLNTGMPEAGPLAAATLVRGDDGERGDLVLAFQHTIVDGVSAAKLWGELLTTYAALADGAVEYPAPAPPPRSADSLIPAAHRGPRMLVPRLRFATRSARDEVRFRRSVFRRSPRVDPAARTMVHSHSFDEDVTQRIDRVAGEHRCTVHSLLHAVVLRAVHEQRYGGVEGWMRTVAFADLRPYLVPAPPTSALSPYIALTSQDVAMVAGRPLWDTVGDVQERVRASVKDGAKFVSYAMAEPLMRMAVGIARMRMGTTAVSHTGPVPIEGADGPLPIEHLHAFVSNLAVGPELSLRTGSFRGRLTLDMMALDADMDRHEFTALATLIAERLDEVARSYGDR